MKKKVVLCFMLGCMMAALAGCSSKETKEAAATEAVTEEDSDGKDSRSDKEADAEVEEETEEKKSSNGPVLGGENVEGYEDFAYLYEEILMTETEENKKTGEKERKKLTVYIPDDDYATASGNYAYSDSMGVNFRVELEPYLRYDADDYLPEENLDEYVSSKYDPFYTADYKDLVITEAEEASEGVISTVEYCRYNEWDEEYYAVFCTYYLAELESGETVLVTVEITSSETTGKTEKLLDELEQFYQFDIDWDADRAEKKCADYAENGAENTYSTGSLLFELPEGWKEDDAVSSYDNRVYAPDGDSEFAECLISIYEDYISYDEEVSLDAVLENNTEAALEESLEVNISDYSAEICETGLGEAAKITYSISDGEDSATITMYFVASDYHVYTLMSMETPDATESAQIVLDGIMATGQLRD